MALTAAEQLEVAQYAGQQLFAAATANFSVADLQAAATALDNAFDTTINAAVTAGFGADTIIEGLNAVIPAPFSGATAAQKTLLCCWVLMKRVGLI